MFTTKKMVRTTIAVSALTLCVPRRMQAKYRRDLFLLLTILAAPGLRKHPVLRMP